MTDIREYFTDRWSKYFPGVDLPVVFYYTDDENQADLIPRPDEWRCVICDLGRVRKGDSILMDVDSISCGGGQRYFGFKEELSPDFDRFLSSGIEGETEGERYKKTPELVLHMMEIQPPFKAPGKYIVFKRWDKLSKSDQPLGVIFFAEPDVLSGLFVLANYDQSSPHGVISPSCSGCSAIVYHPYMESQSEQPRAILGMFDTSARPCVPPQMLTLSMPYAKFVSMVKNMDESNLITQTWSKVKERISRR